MLVAQSPNFDPMTWYTAMDISVRTGHLFQRPCNFERLGFEINGCKSRTTCTHILPKHFDSIHPGIAHFAP